MTLHPGEVFNTFWSGLIDWIKETLMENNKTVSNDDMYIFHIVDEKEEVIKILEDFHNDYGLSPNF